MKKATTFIAKPKSEHWFEIFVTLVEENDNILILMAIPDSEVVTIKRKVLEKIHHAGNYVSFHIENIFPNVYKEVVEIGSNEVTKIISHTEEVTEKFIKLYEINGGYFKDEKVMVNDIFGNAIEFKYTHLPTPRFLIDHEKINHPILKNIFKENNVIVRYSSYIGSTITNIHNHLPLFKRYFEDRSKWYGKEVYVKLSSCMKPSMAYQGEVPKKEKEKNYAHTVVIKLTKEMFEV